MMFLFPKHRENWDLLITWLKIFRLFTSPIPADPGRWKSTPTQSDIILRNFS